jgi:hypothetical protein
VFEARRPASRCATLRSLCGQVVHSGRISRRVGTGRVVGSADARAIGSAGERLVHTEEVTGSIPVSPTRVCAAQTARHVIITGGRAISLGFGPGLTHESR